MKKLYLFFLLLLTFFPLKAQYISVNHDFTAEQLVKQVFFGNQGSNCIQVENIAVNGKTFNDGDKSFGYFNRNGSSFPLAEGILLSTGKLREAVGPSEPLRSTTDNSWGGDTDLENALGINSTHNATILEFDFTSSNANQISFEYIFASEQYLRNNDPGSCGYTDGFAFLIKKVGTTDPYTNLAVIPGTTTPIKSNTVRGAGQKCPGENEEYFDQYNFDESPVNYNGQTKILNAITDVEPNTKYHLKLVIADQGNGLYDSGVFIKAGSFSGVKSLGQDRLLSQNTALCQGSSLPLDATTAGATYQWYKDGNLLNETTPVLNVTAAGKYEVFIDASGCPVKGSVMVELAERPLVLTGKTFCKSNLLEAPDNFENLSKAIITNYEPAFEINFFKDAAGALPLRDLTFTEDTTIYAKVGNSTCQQVTVPVHFNVPKEAVVEIQPFCEGASTTVKLESGYINYKWLTEDRTLIAEGAQLSKMVNLPPGKYFVEFTSANDCKHEQEIVLAAAKSPEITNIQVNGSTLTITAQGGVQPLEYSADGIRFQSANVLTNVSRGLGKVYVRSAAFPCKPVEKEFLIINLVNVITPNGDGINDVLDYSDLRIKNNVKISVSDRYGNRIYSGTGENPVWDGKINGRLVHTGTYWYTLEWTEPDTQLQMQLKGWVLVKNRN